jgi:hypothetical protein
MTELEAVNRALIFLGVEAIGSINDDGKPARTMYALLPAAKRLVLMEFPWSFATRAAALVPAAAPAPEGLGSSFAYPSGALAVRGVYDGTGSRRAVEFSVFGVSGTRYIAAQTDSGSVEYMEEVGNVGQWPEQVVECLAARLASDAAAALTGNPGLASSMMQKYALLAQIAAQVSVVEQRLYPPRASHYVDVRG